MVDLLSRRVTACFFAPATATSYIEAGRLVALATTGLERPASHPDLPTVVESGLAGFVATNWYAFLAPGSTPQAILERWNQELVKVLRAPDVSEQLLGHGLIPAPGSREELRRFIATESDSWAKVISERKITSQ